MLVRHPARAAATARARSCEWLRDISTLRTPSARALASAPRSSLTTGLPGPEIEMSRHDTLPGPTPSDFITASFPANLAAQCLPGLLKPEQYSCSSSVKIRVGLGTTNTGKQGNNNLLRIKSFEGLTVTGKASRKLFATIPPDEAWTVTGEGSKIALTAPDGTVYGVELLNANEQLRASDDGVLVVVNEAVGDRREIRLIG